jgi:hypothetical protein
VAFRCKGRHFCPSCHARRLAEWSVWLEEHLLAPVAHRQVVLTVPKRLRPYFVHDRRRLGLLSRIATRTLRAYVQSAVGEREAVPGLIVCVQTFGSVAHRHPHLHVRMTDGAFRRDGAFVRLPEPEPAVLEELWRRSVLVEFVRRGWLEEDEAARMLGWPHSGFGAYLGPAIEEREGLLRVARDSARAPVAESRLRYDAERAEVELVSDRNDGPYAGVHRMTALAFLARGVDHVPERYEVRVRSAGAYATRRRVRWRRRGVELAGSPAVAATPEPAPDGSALRARWRRSSGAAAARVPGGGRGVSGPACGGYPAGARRGSWRSSPSRRWCVGSWRISTGAGWTRGPSRGRPRRRPRGRAAGGVSRWRGPLGPAYPRLRGMEVLILAHRSYCAATETLEPHEVITPRGSLLLRAGADTSGQERARIR